MLTRLLQDLLRALQRRGRPTQSVPDDLMLALQRAAEMSRAGDLAAAELVLRQATAAHPSYASAQALLANLLDRRGFVAEARKHYERALEIDPRQPELRLAYAGLLQR